MALSKVHVFAGKFTSVDEACLYSQPQWEPEPDESATGAEYSEWEERNPTHKLKESISPYLDEDFIETVPANYQYLASIGIQQDEIDEIDEIEVLSENLDVFVLVYEDALSGPDADTKPRSNSVLKYCGVFECSV